ncbi:histidine kinase, partial [bacterium]|nr:histidine kinase [bacterium]
MEKSPTTLINTEKETRSFFWFMTLILACLAIWVIIELPHLHKLRNLIPFVLCMVTQIILHWMLRRFIKKPWWTVGYMITQGSLTAAMILISHHIGITVGLTMALIGEAIGVYGISKKGFLSALFYTLLSFGFYVLILGGKELIWWVIATVPMMVFVVLYVELYSRQANSNIKAQKLLKELETTNQQLTKYAAQVEDLTIASERQRMARELHDTLSQGLAGLILQLEAVDANLSSGKTDRSRQIVQQAMESARQTLFEARLAIDDLRQEKLSDCCSDIDKKISQFTKNTGIPCE